MNNDNYKEVYFHEYCPTCKHRNVNDSPYDGRVIHSDDEDDKDIPKENPCDDCLGEPCRKNSHRPLRYESK